MYMLESDITPMKGWTSSTEVTAGWRHWRKMGRAYKARGQRQKNLPFLVVWEHQPSELCPHSVSRISSKVPYGGRCRNSTRRRTRRNKHRKVWSFSPLKRCRYQQPSTKKVKKINWKPCRPLQCSCKFNLFYLDISTCFFYICLFHSLLLGRLLRHQDQWYHRLVQQWWRSPFGEISTHGSGRHFVLCAGSNRPFKTCNFTTQNQMFWNQ